MLSKGKRQDWNSVALASATILNHRTITPSPEAGHAYRELERVCCYSFEPQGNLELISLKNHFMARLLANSFSTTHVLNSPLTLLIPWFGPRIFKTLLISSFCVP